MGGVPHVIVATSGRREPDGRRVDVAILAAADGRVWTVLRIFEGIRCVGTQLISEGSAEEAQAAAEIFNETVRALSADGIDGLEEIPDLHGYEIAQAAVYVTRSGEQPHLDERFDLSVEDWETLVRAAGR
jgi:hypothetical protein